MSTVKQGEHGVSLQQQKEAIERHAQRHGLSISRWFEEQETAAKRGRPLFSQMIKLLRRGVSRGVIMHKIDRSARNLRDWADLGELIDQGVEVHFANEALDLNSRGGRLSADIQAVVAADYVRNLREETKKGFYGRLKQGLFPMPAPIGYLNNGQGKPKTPHPAIAPLVRRAFELYSTGRFNLLSLAQEMAKQGLKREDGSPLHRNRFSDLLNNPFYFGLIRLRRTGACFTGIHEPLVSKQLFDRVQSILQGKVNTKSEKHDLLYRRRVRCKLCEHSLIGETQKGFVYYRCQVRQCPTTCIREEVMEGAVLHQLARLRLSSDEVLFLRQSLHDIRAEAVKRKDDAIRGLELGVVQLDQQLERLTDAYIDRLIERDLFEERKKTLLSKRLDLQAQLSDWKLGKRSLTDEVSQILEQGNSAYLTYKHGNKEEKRGLLDSLTSNCQVEGKTPIVLLKFPFAEVANRFEVRNGGPTRDIPRTWDSLLGRLIPFTANDSSPTLT